MARIDYTKVDNNRLEEMAIHDKHSERLVKQAGFELRMDRINKSIKNAKSEEELRKFQKIKEETLNRYNKYHNTTFKN